MIQSGTTILWEKLDDKLYNLYFNNIEDKKEFGTAEQSGGNNEQFFFNSRFEFSVYDSEDLQLIAAALDTIKTL